MTATEYLAARAALIRFAAEFGGRLVEKDYIIDCTDPIRDGGSYRHGVARVTVAQDATRAALLAVAALAIEHDVELSMYRHEGRAIVTAVIVRSLTHDEIAAVGDATSAEVGDDQVPVL